MNAQDTALILLASGASSRFGAQDKLLVEHNGKPILRHSLTAYASIDFGLRLGVVASPESETVSILKNNNFEIIINPRANDGMGTSIAAGTKAARKSGFNSVMIGLADMPLVPAEHIQNLFHTAHDGDIVMTCVGERLMPPALFSGAALNDLQDLGGDQGAKSIAIIRGYRAVDLAPELAIDIDRPKDLARITQT